MVKRGQSIVYVFMSEKCVFRCACTGGGCLPHCGSAAVDCGQTCATVRRTEGLHCIVVEEEAVPGIGGNLSVAHHDKAGVNGDFHESTAALGCGCQGSTGVQAEGCGQGLWVVLSSGHYGMFGGSQFLPHGESSAQIHYRLQRSKKEKKKELMKND